MAKSEVDIAEYYVDGVVSLINALFLTIMLIRYGYLFKSDKWAIIVYLCLIMLSLEPIWMIDIFIPFTKECSIHENNETAECKRCWYGGYLHEQLVRITWYSIVLMLIKILEINFQPFAFLAYPRIFIHGFKIVVVALFVSPIVFNIVGLMPLDVFSVHEVKGWESNHICHKMKSDMSKMENVLRRNLRGIFYISCIILCWSLFIHRIIRLYNYRRAQSRVDDMKKMRQNVKIMVYAIVIPIVRQTILISMMLIAAILQWFSDEIWVLQPFAVIFLGTCVILMFSQKKPWFQFFCSSLETKLISRWVQVQLDGLKRYEIELQKQKGKGKKKKCNRPNVDGISRKKSKRNKKHKSINIELGAIGEIEKTVEIQEWSLADFYNPDENESPRTKTVLETVTQSDILEAMIELDFHRRSNVPTGLDISLSSV